MTFFHLLNCAAVTSAPFVITYKCTVLSEYSSFWKCVQAGAFYVITQLLKLLILATFFPASTGDPMMPATTIGGVLNIARATVDLLDLVGLYFAMEQLGGGKGEIKFMVAGTGWAAAEVILGKFIHLWFGARGIEFDWKYMLLCLDSNLILLQHIATATFIWMWARQHLSSRVTSFVSMALLMTSYKPLILEHLKVIVGYNDWMGLIMNGVMTCSVAFSCMYTYVTLTKVANGVSHQK
ncbi:BOS complex subunit TMEM147-like [Symsagittifera roscoffensis]|uniref:BOS complex subunit TMEM147-like n=1 Tax=Symsagittifera roscoffensis TaxID=84072 RepID=UPI00307BB649